MAISPGALNALDAKVVNCNEFAKEEAYLTTSTIIIKIINGMIVCTILLIP